MNIEDKDWIIIAAIILGPIIAIQTQNIIEALKSKKERKLNLFFTLMSTRNTRLSNDHVYSLNMIDIEFSGKNFFWFWKDQQTSGEKKVTDSWKAYSDHLRNSNFNEDRNELFTEMLYEMSQTLGYGFDKVNLKRDCYRPEGHNQLENQKTDIMNGVVELLEGKRSLPVNITSYNDNLEEHPREIKKDRISFLP